MADEKKEKLVTIINVSTSGRHYHLPAEAGSKQKHRDLGPNETAEVSEADAKKLLEYRDLRDASKLTKGAADKNAALAAELAELKAKNAELAEANAKLLEASQKKGK